MRNAGCFWVESQFCCWRELSPDHSWESSAHEYAMARKPRTGLQQRAFRSWKNTRSAGSCGPAKTLHTDPVRVHPSFRVSADVL